MPTIDDLLKQVADLEGEVRNQYDVLHGLTVSLESAFSKGDINFVTSIPLPEQTHVQSYLAYFQQVRSLEHRIRALYDQGRKLEAELSKPDVATPIVTLRLHDLDHILNQVYDEIGEVDDSSTEALVVAGSESKYKKVIRTLELLADISLDFAALQLAYQQLSHAVEQFKQAQFIGITLPIHTTASDSIDQIERVAEQLEEIYLQLAGNFRRFLSFYGEAELELQPAYNQGVSVLRRKTRYLCGIREIQTQKELSDFLTELKFVKEQGTAATTIRYPSLETIDHDNLLQKQEQRHLDKLTKAVEYANRVYHSQEDITELYSQWNACMAAIPRQQELFGFTDHNVTMKIREAKTVYTVITKALKSIQTDLYPIASPFLQRYVIEPNTPQREDVQFLESFN